MFVLHRRKLLFLLEPLKNYDIKLKAFKKASRSLCKEDSNVFKDYGLLAKLLKIFQAANAQIKT